MMINPVTSAKVMAEFEEFLKKYGDQSISDPSCGLIQVPGISRLNDAGLDLFVEDERASTIMGKVTTAWCYEQKSTVSYRRNREALVTLCRYWLFSTPKKSRKLKDSGKQQDHGAGGEVPQDQTPPDPDGKTGETVERLREWLKTVKETCEKYGGIEYPKDVESEQPYPLPAYRSAIVPEQIALEAAALGPMKDLDKTDFTPWLVGKMNAAAARIAEAIPGLPNKYRRPETQGYLETLALVYYLKIRSVGGGDEANAEKLCGTEYIRFPKTACSFEYGESLLYLIDKEHFLDRLVRTRKYEDGHTTLYCWIEGFPPKKTKEQEQDKTDRKRTAGEWVEETRRISNGYHQGSSEFWGISLRRAYDEYKKLSTEIRPAIQFNLSAEMFSAMKEKSFDDKRAKKLFDVLCESKNLSALYETAKTEEKKIGAANANAGDCRSIAAFNRTARYCARLTTLYRIMAEQGKKGDTAFRPASWHKIPQDLLDKEKSFLESFLDRENSKKDRGAEITESRPRPEELEGREEM